MEHFSSNISSFLEQSNFFEDDVEQMLTLELLNTERERSWFEELGYGIINDQTIKTFEDDNSDLSIGTNKDLEHFYDRNDFDISDNDMPDRNKYLNEYDTLSSGSKYIPTNNDELDLLADNDSYWFDDEHMEDDILYVGQSLKDSHYIDEDAEILSKNIPSACPYDNKHWYVSCYDLNLEDEDGCTKMNKNNDCKENCNQEKEKYRITDNTKNQTSSDNLKPKERKYTEQEKLNVREDNKLCDFKKAEDQAMNVDLKILKEKENESEKEKYLNCTAINNVEDESSANAKQSAGYENEDMHVYKELGANETTEVVDFTEGNNEPEDVEEAVRQCPYGIIANVIKNFITKLLYNT